MIIYKIFKKTDGKDLHVATVDEASEIAEATKWAKSQNGEGTYYVQEVTRIITGTEREVWCVGTMPEDNYQDFVVFTIYQDEDTLTDEEWFAIARENYENGEFYIK